MNKDVTLLGLALGLLLMLLPLWYLRKFRTGLVSATISATLRMIVQLYLVGLYLQYLFELNIWWVNLLWGLVMVGVATGTAAQRTQLKPHILLLPMGIAFLVTSLLISLYFLGLVQGLGTSSWQELFTARYFISIFGILLGNMLGVNVLAVSTFYDGLRREQQQIDYLLGNGATLHEATAPLIRAAIIKAFNPCIANMSIMGLVAMPGTMIGQILGGSPPATAIRYQMMIAVITFAASMLSLIITINLAQRRSFDEFSRLQEVFKT